MELIFTVGDNNDEYYQRTGIAYVTDDEAIQIMEPFDKAAEKTYDDFCDTGVPKAINNLPRDWYFIKCPKQYEGGR